jgi:tRNA pseudouridine55 synthase
VHGWIVIDKPVGPGSTGIVGAVKRALREGGYPRVKVGHGGTLDPLASGVLPVALGEATKLSGRMLNADKLYEFTIAFGTETDTLDLEGQVVATSDRRPTLAEVEEVLPLFTGEIDQVPPAYSALKIDGKRAYDRARAGEEVEMKPRRVTVHSLEVKEDPHPTIAATLWSVRGTDLSPQSRKRESGKKEPRAGAPLLPLAGASGRLSPRDNLNIAGRCSPDAGWDEGLLLSPLLLPSITLSAQVSKGTYIRALARDIARALGTFGHVAMLRRTRAGPFTLEQAISLDKLAESAKGRTLEQCLLPLTAGLDDIPALPVSPDQAGALRQGRVLIGIAAQPGLHLATDNNVPVALVELDEGCLRVLRGFNL